MKWIGIKNDVPIRLLGSVQDITERKQAEQELQASEEKYRSLVQKINIGVVAHGPDTRILFFNARASQLLGITPDQMLGKSAIDPAWHFIREDGTRMPLEEYPVNQAMAADEPLSNLPLGILRPDREGTTWVQCNAHKDRDKDGKLLQVIVTFTDITERKLAEEKLRESEDKFKYVFDHSSVGKTFTFPTGEMNENEAFREMLGYTHEELGKLKFLDITHPDDIALSEEAVRLLLSGERESIPF